MPEPETLKLASPEMRRAFYRVLWSAKTHLQEHLHITDGEAENELSHFPEAAFMNAINVALALSPKAPVQPDWLVAITARQLWFLACKLAWAPS
jgi:hypothetical protein